MNLKDGEFAVKFARKTIEMWISRRETPQFRRVTEAFREKSGVFTTLYTYPEKELRGCIGLPYPNKPLIQAIMESAVSATMDPRFPKLREEELDKVTIEVSVLTKPEKLNVKSPFEYLEKVKIGRDGLIIKKGPQAGLLLPQVPVEYGWNVKTFLEHLCMKAFLPQDAWKDKDTEIYRFHSEIFAEEEPSGNVKAVSS
jgi:uncharacterized protein (TIGR00296 family)